MPELLSALTVPQATVAAVLGLAALLALWASLRDPAIPMTAPAALPAWVGFSVSLLALAAFAVAPYEPVPALTRAGWTTWALAITFVILPGVYFVRLAQELANLALTAEAEAEEFDVIDWLRRVGASATLSVVGFAWAFRLLGIVPPSGPNVDFGRWDSLYLSMVTFSTLGYGDFQPGPDARLIAAMEAIAGNLHLGLFVGLVLVAVGRGGRA